MAGGTTDQRGTPTRLRPIPPILFVVAAVVIVGCVSPGALITVLIDGISAAVILLPAVLGGLVLVPLFRLGPLPMRWHLLIGSVLGIGCMSQLVLLLGMAGFLQRSLWIAILTGSAVAGALRLRLLMHGGPSIDGFRSTERIRPKPAKVGRRHADRGLPGDVSLGDATGATDEPPHAPAANAFHYVWLLAIPALSLALLAASNPPGFVWVEEGNGYDVLTYHLQLPKEYLQAGRIEFLPHNVYGSFPANVEMLYLLGMNLLGNVYDAGTVANMIHVYLAVLAVFAAWVAGREWSVSAGVVCGVVVATAGWLPFLCGLAYVENGMLFFGMASAAALVRLFRTRGFELDRAPRTVPWLALGGVASGFACGCKYTAGPMIALPLGLMVLFAGTDSFRRRLLQMALFFVAALAATSPWLIKNQVRTGNPVFPLANTIFEATPPGWTMEETARFDAGHSLRPEQQSTIGKMRLLWNHVLNDKYQRFGPAIFALSALALVRRRWSRVELALVGVAAIQLAVWLLATHLFARFMVVLLIPLALLAGGCMRDSAGSIRRWTVLTLLVAGAVWNLSFTTSLHRNESVPGIPASAMYDGLVPDFEYFEVVNHDLPESARILLVGDAKAFYFRRSVEYCVTFNRNPFFARLIEADTASEVMEWLRKRGTTHVLVNWSELRRLAGSYGLSPGIDLSQLETWFKRLSAAGLRLSHEFHRRDSTARYIELYELPTTTAAMPKN